MNGTEHQMALLDVQGLRKIYGTGSKQVEAVRDLTFTVEAGELVCIVGPSGAGKTTLLRCIAGLMPPTSGTLTLGGAPIDRPPADMALVFQEYGRSLFPWKTVAQNVELPLKQGGIPRAERRQRVADALEAVGLASVGDQHPWELSGGMQQRVAIARAVAYQPRIMLMDEPFAAVDAQTRADLEDLVRSLWRERGITVLFVTHDIDESVYLAQRVLVLSKSPTVVRANVEIDLPVERSQLATRALPRFTELRTEVFELIQQSKGGSLDLATL